MIFRKKWNIASTDWQSVLTEVDGILLYGPFALLMFGPLAFGSVEPWSMLLFELGSILLVLLWLAKQCFSESIKIHVNPLFLPMLIFAGLVLIQIMFGLSASRSDTISQTLLYLAYGMLSFLVTQTLRRNSQARMVATILVIYGVAIAVFALLQGVAPNGKIYWLRVPRLGGRIYGPYVNHNHYAGLMEMLVPIPLVVALSRLAADKTRIAAGVAAAIMAGTIFLSGSRGGMISVFAEFAVLAVICFRQRRSLRIAMGVAAFAVVLISLLVWLGGKELTSTVGSISSEARGEISGGTRFSIAKDGIRMFAHRPVLGWGLGSFPVMYPHFRSFYTNFFVNEAHNDYVQLLAEMGIFGFGTMVWFLVATFRQARRKLTKWTTEVSGAATLACTLGVIGILVHSLVDFNLQIPANAALFYVVCSIAAAPPLLQRLRRPKPVTSLEPEFVPTSEVV
jgi:O-antigen ligase